MNDLKKIIKNLLILLLLSLGMGLSFNANAATKNFELWDDGFDYLDPANHPMIFSEFKDYKWYPYVGYVYEPWRGIFYNQGLWQIDYDYAPELFVNRNGSWVNLKDVNNTICAGEQIKGLNDIVAEWRGTAGSLLGTPLAFLKDDFNWSDIDGCKDESFFTTLENSWQYSSNPYGMTGFSFSNSLYAPTIFKNPSTLLSGALDSCEGSNCSPMNCTDNVCTAAGPAGTYKLNFVINETEARQHYWQFGRISDGRAGGCYPLNYYGKNCQYIIEESWYGHPNVICDNSTSRYAPIESFKSMFPVMESKAVIPEWSSNNNAVNNDKYIVKVENCDQCGKDNICNPLCNPPDPDCCQDNDGRCDANCSPCDLDCINCCGADGRCNPNCIDPCDKDCSGCGVVPAGSCTVIRTSPSDTNKATVGDTIKFQASVFGGLSPIAYNWSCDNTSTDSQRISSTSRTDQHDCVYNQERTYEPKVGYEYKDEKGNNLSQECINTGNISVDISKGELPISSCNVMVRNSSDSYTNSIEVRSGDAVDIKVNFEGNRKDSIVWKFNGIQDDSQKENKAITGKIINKTTKIEAIIDGVECSSADININTRETIQWGL